MIGSRPGTLLLELDLTQTLAEPAGGDPLDRLRNRGRRLLRPTLRALHEAGADDRVGGLVAKLGGPLTWAAAQELRSAVAAFAASGKPAYAWAESLEAGGGATAAYVLATAFEQIWLQPGGGLGPLGVAVETTFLRGALDKVGIEPQLEQRKEYKNAVDRISRTAFTAPHRESLDRLAGSIFDTAVDAIAAGRQLEPDRVRELIDRGTLTAAEAQQAKLVDRLGYRDQVYADLRSRLSAPDAGGSADGVELRYADRWTPPDQLRTRVRRRLRREPQVGLVQISGAIAGGPSRRSATGRQVGSDTVAAELRAAAADDRLAAVVLHVDSPGGSAVASETIWREVVRVREAGKPVVVSMGSAAASGGYYVACPADAIVALPATLTGSIGVFGGKFVVAELLDKAGLSTDTVHRGDRALMFSARRGFAPAERERLAAMIDAIYADFVAKVAAGRGRTVAEIEAVARGRVWTGADAVEVGLVDELGDLRHAVSLARTRAGLSSDAAVRRPIQLPWWSRLRPVRNSEDPRSLAGAGLWSLGTELAALTTALGLPAGRQLRMPALALR